MNSVIENPAPDGGTAPAAFPQQGAVQRPSKATDIGHAAFDCKSSNLSFRAFFASVYTTRGGRIGDFWRRQVISESLDSSEMGIALEGIWEAISARFSNGRLRPEPRSLEELTGRVVLASRTASHFKPITNAHLAIVEDVWWEFEHAREMLEELERVRP